MKNIVAYVPVLHKGYVNFFNKYKGKLYLVGPDFVSKEFPRLIRDLRQLPAEEMAQAIKSLNIFESVEVLTKEQVKGLRGGDCEIVMPDEDISHVLAKEYFDQCVITYENVFLRWDKPITLAEQEVSPDRIISTNEVDKNFLTVAAKESEKSSDWWRQIGAVVVKDDKIIFKDHNKYLPTDYNLFAAGNPRDNFDAGEHPEIYTSIHGEASIVAQAARAGVSLKDAEIYVTTFPCANCARLLTEAGVKRVCYRDGYSRLDAEDIFTEGQVEVVLVRDEQ